MPAIIKVVDGRTVIQVGENSALAAASATLAEQFANDAGLSADAAAIAAAAVGVYTTVGDGESATTNGQSFYVASGGGVTLYLNNAGTGDEVASIVTTAKLASTAPGEGGSLVGLEGGETVQDVSTSVDVQVVAGSDPDPLIPGSTFADTAAAESVYPNSRVIRQSGPTVFVRPDLADGAIDAERYGVGENQTAAENGARLSWLINRGYRKITHRARVLEASGIEIVKSDSLTLQFHTLTNTATDGSHLFLINKDAAVAQDNTRMLNIRAKTLNNVAGSGHIFNIEGLLFDSHELTRSVDLIQNYSVNAGIFYFDPSATVPGRATNVIFSGGTWRTPQAATVPMLFQDAAQSSFNNNIVVPNQMFAGDQVPAIMVHNRSTASVYASGNKFILPSEYTGVAGLLHITGHRNPLITSNSFDETHWGSTAAADRIFVGGYDEYVTRYPGYDALSYSGTPPACQTPEISGYIKAAAMTMGSWFDIYLGRVDGFWVHGCNETALAGSRSIEVSAPTSPGTFGPHNKNVVITGFDPSIHTIDDRDGFRAPTIFAGGKEINADTPIGVAAAIVSLPGAFVTNKTTMPKAFTGVSKTGTGVYELTLGVALSNTAPIVSLSASTVGDRVFSYVVDSTTKITVNCRSSGALTDGAFCIEVKE